MVTLASHESTHLKHNKKAKYILFYKANEKNPEWKDREQTNGTDVFTWFNEVAEGSRRSSWVFFPVTLAMWWHLKCIYFVQRVLRNALSLMKATLVFSHAYFVTLGTKNVDTTKFKFA